MIRRCLTLFLLAVSASLPAQPYWARDFGGLGADHVADVRVDAAGGVFVAGEFSNSFTYDGTTLTSAGGVDGFVARLDALGALVWLVQVGGAGTDRAIKVDVDANGNIAVAGEFTGLVNAFGGSITSAGGTVDMFVAKLDAANGALQWVRQGGSDTWADRPYGVTIAGNGAITVAGEFKGAAIFDGSPITSLVDPLTQLPGFDVFIASYDASGTLLWLQQGAASHVDRAIDVVSDATGNIYVCGQYTDTITFDVQHPGLSLNATFLVKFDAGGVEQWFRRCGGATFNHVRDMQWTSSGTLALCGDLQGTMLFEDNAPDPVVGGGTYAGYILEVDANGELVVAQTLASDNAMGVSGLVQHGNEVALLGFFQCHLTSLADLYGQGTFLATGAPDLFIARYAFPGVQYNDAQQFGGKEGKQAGRIAAMPGGDLVFSGSYADRLVIPSDGQNWGDAPFQGVNGGSTFCGDPAYGAFTSNESMGLFDGFVARAFVDGREPYDFWQRSGGPCLRPDLDLCVRRYQIGPPCPAQIDVCEPIVLELTTPFAWTDAFMPPQPDEGPEMEILWSDGSNGPFISAYTGGWYWCTMSTSNGCWSVTDSVYVNLAVPPNATISDGLGINYATSYPQPLYPCDTSVWLWCPTVMPGETVSWTGPGGVFVPGDSILADVSGQYTVLVTAPNGCMDTVGVNVYVTPSDPLPNITSVDMVLYDPWGGILDGDTIPGCPNSTVAGLAEVTFYINGQPGPIPVNIVTGYNSFGLPGGSTLLPGEQMLWYVPAYQGTGWYPFTFTVNIYDSPCPSDTLTFTQQDSIYFLEVQEPVVIVPDTVILCPDGVAVIPVNCTGCDQFLWQGPGIVSTSPLGDTAYVDANGLYILTVSVQEGTAICGFNYFTYVLAPEIPLLYTDPPDGLVCPGDTALLYTTQAGSLYQWEGPDGPLNINNDTVVVAELGAYYLLMTDLNGCVSGAGPIALSGFGSPFISVQGDSVLCEGDSIVLQVIASGATDIAWQPPFSGNATTQVVTQPGLYLCWVTTCGVPYLLNMPIGLSVPQAEIIAPDPAVICDGAPVLLQGAPGAETYLWLPGGPLGPDKWVTQPGYYQLLVTDAYGCTDTSDYIYVGSASITEPLSTEGDSACVGGAVTLSASGSGLLTWYADAAGANSAGSGTAFPFGPITGDTLFYVQQVDGPCASALLPVPATAIPLPSAPILPNDTALCEGASVTLVASGASGTTFTWTLPVGAATGDTLMLPAPVIAGVYQCVATLQGCVSDVASVSITLDECELFIPNVFSPNGDGSNDTFTLESPNGLPLELDILNRWGQQVYEAEGPLIRWNGRSERGGTLVSEGVYYYVITLPRTNGTVQTWTGYVQVLR